MSFLKQFGIGLHAYLDALQLIRRHKMYSLLFISFFLFLIILALCVFLVYLGNDQLIRWIMNISWVKNQTTFLGENSWIIKLVKWSIILSSLFLFISFYKYLFLALASPLYAYISEKGAEKWNRKTYPFSVSQFVKDIWRGVRISLRCLIRQMLLTLLLFILSFIPVIGILFTVMIILLDSYYYGFAMLDYNCEREKMSVRQSINWIRKHQGLCLGNGIMFYVTMIVLPVIGVIFIAPVSTIAATIGFYKMDRP